MIRILALLAALFISTQAHAQSSVTLWCYNGASPNITVPCSSTYPVPVNVVSGGGTGGTSAIDEAAFTYGASSYTPAGGVYNASITNLTSGQGGAAALTAARSMHMLDDNSAAILAGVTSAIPAGTNVIGYVTNDPCTQAAKTNVAISFQATSSAQLVAASGSTKIYVCSLSLIASVATVFSLTGGTGTNCGTPAALIGTTSATHGLSLAANGGLTLGNGAGTIAVTAASSEVCIVQSGAGDLVGNLTYVQQ